MFLRYNRSNCKTSKALPTGGRPGDQEPPEPSVQTRAFHPAKWPQRLGSPHHRHLRPRGGTWAGSSPGRQTSRPSPDPPLLHLQLIPEKHSWFT